MSVTTSKKYYSKDQLQRLKKGPIPTHIAVIPDGNRRWAARKGNTCTEGHKEGCDAVLDIIRAGKEMGVSAFTFYSFSTENWHRPQQEIEALMNLLITYLQDETPNMVENGIRLMTIGDTSKLRKDVQDQLALSKQATKDCRDIDFIMALNYGGRDEICRAINRILDDPKGIRGKCMDEDLFSSYLDTAEWEDPQLLVRTSGEKRLSNFLLWQLSYAEIYTTHTLWPDFHPDHLFEAVQWYQQREQRKGK